MGTFPLFHHDVSHERLPIVAWDVTVPFITTHRRPPIGAPARFGKPARDCFQERYDFQTALRPADEYLDQVLTGLQVLSIRTFSLNALHALLDHYLQLTGKSFEYPCADLPYKVRRFIGPVTLELSAGFKEAEWWNTLGSDRSIVLVMQSTVVNFDLGDLIVPILQALAGENLTVIAALGRGVSEYLPVPPNAHVVLEPASA